MIEKRKQKKENKSKEYFIYKNNTHTEIQELMAGYEKKKKIVEVK